MNGKVIEKIEAKPSSTDTKGQVDDGKHRQKVSIITLIGFIPYLQN